MWSRGPNYKDAWWCELTACSGGRGQVTHSPQKPPAQSTPLKTGILPHSRSRDLIIFNSLHSSAPEIDFPTDTPHFPVLHFRMLHKYLLFFFKHTEGLWQPGLEQVYRWPLPSSVCSLWATVWQFSQPSRIFHHYYYRICNGDVWSAVFDVTTTIR